MKDAAPDLTTLQDFIVGRLSDRELQAFEDRLVGDPALVRELEQSLRMREGLEQLRGQQYFGKTAPGGRRVRVWMPALAAAAVTGLGLFLWLSRVTGPSEILLASPEPRLAGKVPTQVAAHFTFVAMRGGSAPDLDLPSAQLIEIRAQPEAREIYHRYRVTLVRQNEAGSFEPVAALAGLTLSADGYVHCYADASRLSRGRYVLRIQPDTDTGGMAEEFPFNLHAGVTGSSR
jgi:hypothetical protein